MYRQLIVLFYFYIEFMSKVHSYDYQIDPTKHNNAQRSNPEWIDPFDMGLDSSYSYDKYKSKSQEDSLVNPNVIGWRDFDSTDISKQTGGSHSHSSDKFIIYQRFINIFLQAMALKDTPEIIGSKLIQLDLVISGSDLRVLQGFGTNGAKGGNVEQISEIVNKIFLDSQLRTSSVESRLSRVLEWFGKAVTKVISSPEWTITTTVVTMMVAVLWLVFVTRSYRLAFFWAFFMIFILGFGFTWMRMYEEKEIERFYGQVVHGDAPYHCKGHSLAWYQTIYYYWFGDDCLKFYKTRDVRPIVKISPTEVLSVTLSTMVIEPAQNIGRAYGSFINGVIKHVPWYIAPLVVPLVIIIPPLFIIVILAFFFGYRLSFSITGIHLIPSWSRSVSHGPDDKYVEDVSRRAHLSQSKGVYETILSDCKNPLVLMNLPAITTFFSNLSNENKSNAAPNTAKTENEETSTGGIAKSECGSCKKRTKKSLYTCRTGSASKSDIQSSESDLRIVSGDDGDQSTAQTDVEEEILLNKNKTS